MAEEAVPDLILTEAMTIEAAVLDLIGTAAVVTVLICQRGAEAALVGAAAAGDSTRVTA